MQRTAKNATTKNGYATDTAPHTISDAMKCTYAPGGTFPAANCREIG